MGDMGDDFRALRKWQKEKRQSNLLNSTEILKSYNINFEEKNGGVHLIIRHNDKTLDFYPSTGLWWDRENKRQKRGVFPLLRYLGVKVESAKPQQFTGIVIIDDHVPF